jgi:divalent metal cation (Fe/Co/Zn/Cd) transporter
VEDRARDLRRALWLSGLSIAWNGVAGTIAVYVALASGSLALLGFGADAVIDSVASVALIWRFLVESSQPERAARVERLAERVVGIALMALALYLVVGSARSLASQSHPEATFVGVALLLVSAVALPPLAIAKYRVASRLGSGALRADSVLTAVAGLLAVISLGSLALSAAFGTWWADAVAALIVAVIVLREGWSAWRPGLVELPDNRPPISQEDR